MYEANFLGTEIGKKSNSHFLLIQPVINFYRTLNISFIKGNIHRPPFNYRAHSIFSNKYLHFIVNSLNLGINSRAHAYLCVVKRNDKYCDSFKTCVKPNSIHFTIS